MKRILVTLGVLGCFHVAAGPLLGGLIGGNVLISNSGARFPDVAYNPTNGTYLVVWTDYNQSPLRVVGRRVDGNGATVGSIFNINSGVSYGMIPSVCHNPTNNEWLVAWDDGRDGVDHVYGQRVRGSDGVLLGGNFIIGSVSGGTRSQIAWSSTYNTYLVCFTNYAECFGQRVSNTGTLLGGNFNISNDAVFSGFPMPAAGPGGTQYLVTWDHNPSGNLALIRGCRIDASNGALIGSPFNITSTNVEDRSCVTLDTVNNRYWVQWNQSNPGMSYDQYARFVSTSGTLIGGTIAVLATTDFEGDSQFGGDCAYLPGVNRFWVQGANVGSFLGYTGVEYDNNTGVVQNPKKTLGLGDFMIGNCAADTTLNRYLSCWEGYVGSLIYIHIQIYGTDASVLPGPASNPNPANGATLVNINADPSWTAGAGATSHDVRFGTVNPPPFVVNQTSTTYAAPTLSPNTVYYWRIDEKNASGTTTGTVWSFTTLPLPGVASAPNPANGATGVSVNADPSWTAGSNTTSHDVYFGTSNPPPFVANQTSTTYAAPTLSASTTYFWRINEKNSSGTTTGSVWSFTTGATPPCFSDAFAYANGNLNGNGSWSGSATSQIQIVSQTVKINGGATSFDAKRTVSCGASGGLIQIAAKVQKGTGASTMWSLWFDDTAGVNICRWYGTGTTATGRIGGTSIVTSAQTLTGNWDNLLVKINPAAQTAEFLFNGASIGTLNYSGQGAGNTLGRLRFERINNSGAAGHFLSLDDLVVN